MGIELGYDNTPGKVEPLSAEVITAGLRLLVDPGDVVELRSLRCEGRTWSGFFDGEQLDEMAAVALDLDRKCPQGVYFTFNPVCPDNQSKRDLMSRRRLRAVVAAKGETTEDEDVKRRKWLLVDADPVRYPSDISSTDTEKSAAKETAEAVRVYLRASGWPEPILADSGNGYHLLYRVDLAATEKEKTLVRKCLHALSDLFSDDAVNIDTTVCNASRIVKLYGTVGRKGESTSERPHRCSAILETPNERIAVPGSLIESLAELASVPEAPQQTTTMPPQPPANAVYRAKKYLEKLPPSISGSKGHNKAFRAACVTILDYGLSPDEAFPLLKEWNQTCQPPWSDEELWHKLEDADKKPGPRGGKLNEPRRSRHSGCGSSTPAAAGGAGVDKPTIDSGNRRLDEITAQAWAAIEQSNHPPILFRHAGLPVRIERNDKGEPIIRSVQDESRMRHILARAANWQKVVGSGDKARVVDDMPPVPVVKDVLSTPDMPLPVLTRIVEAPVFAKDGSLQTEPGYHPASQTLYIPQPGFRVPDVSQRPTTAEVDQARSLLCDDLLVDFPFTSDSERAHAVALLLLPFARDLISGPTPLHMLEKPIYGTGATLLVDMLSYPATGRNIPVMTEGGNEDEWRKRITAKLVDGPQFMLIDNLRKRLESGALAAALTSDTWEDRLLGQSATLRIPVRCCWVATGNNPSVSGEMSRRIVRIRLDARVDRPFLRNGFKHENLEDWSKQNRGRLVWAALTLIRAWIAAGKPPGRHSLGKYDDWAKVMGGILDVSGVRGFLENRNEFYDESDSEGAQWRSFIVAWWDSRKSKPSKVSELFRLIGDDVALSLGDGNDQSRKVTLGKMLAQSRDRRFDIELEEGESPRTLQVCLRRGDTKKGAVEWRLEELGKAGPPVDGESAPRLTAHSPGDSPAPEKPWRLGVNHSGIALR